MLEDAPTEQLPRVKPVSAQRGARAHHALEITQSQSFSEPLIALANAGSVSRCKASCWRSTSKDYCHGAARSGRELV